MAPVQKNVLAPGDSTVVELVFNTSSVARPPMNVRKNANVTSNDPVAVTLPINFSAKVVPDTDTVSTVVFGPNLLAFGPESRKLQVTFENVKDSVGLNIKPVGHIMDEFAFKLPGKPIMPEYEGNIEIEWKGDVPEYDANRSITFETGSKESPRFSVAYTIKGEKGPRPAPPPKQKPTVTSQTGAGTTVRGATATRPTTTATKADTTGKVTTPWGEKVWPPK